MMDDIKMMIMEVIKYNKLNKEKINKQEEKQETENMDNGSNKDFRSSYESHFMFWEEEEEDKDKEYSRNNVSSVSSNDTILANHSTEKEYDI